MDLASIERTFPLLGGGFLESALEEAEADEIPFSLMIRMWDAWDWP